ncbi:metallophosphatase domain-containing protein [Flavobacterium dauae]|uniref:metallophosphatase domain-containing protein n=1 Tax=Flavobacterium dauae TaxID=1563479 RepID=UPI00101B4071|nr:metallophosphatase domain-containing protein [Flavobacterium dauae]WLD25065.1 metallophosphatase domain-containing protein [Flavobacterium dauae]
MLINYKNKQIAVFADTHGMHRKLPIKEVDIAIHLGDACTFGNNAQFTDFLDWFSQYPAKYKLFVAGNHELQWEESPEAFLQMFPKNIIFLENSTICIEDITFVSVPARMGLRSTPKINLPEKVDFLLTHAPPKDVLDNGFGCPILKKFVTKLKPVYHLFGHIHETAGQTIGESKTIFMNVAFLKSCSDF